MTRGARALLWPTVAAGLAFLALVSLGVWQIRRLGEKEALIARIEARATLAAAPPPPAAQWPTLESRDYDFVHVRARGHYASGRDALIFMKPPEGLGPEPGYMAVTPFILSSGGAVLVERGFVPASRAQDPLDHAPPGGETTIEGLLRAPQMRNFFTPADQPARGVWYTRDPKSIAAALGLAEAAPFTLALESPSSAGADGFPRLVATTPEIINNHLSYAITWFSLAAALLVIFVLFALGRRARAA